MGANELHIEVLNHMIAAQVWLSVIILIHPIFHFNGLVEGEKYRTPGSLHTIRAPQGFPVTLPEKILGLLGGFSILACPTEKYRIDHQGLKIRHGVEN